jgi:hypothetical protein
MKSDSEEKNLWWRVQKGGAKIAYFRKIVDGRDRWVSLGELEPSAARALVRERRRELGEIELMRMLGTAQAAKGVSTVKAALAAYRTWFAGTAGEAATAAKNEASLLLILKRGAGVGAEASIARFDVDTVKAYEAAAIRAVRARAEAEAWPKEKLEAKLASALRTVAATLRQARSVFCEAALRSAQYRGLSLPEMGEALKVEAGDRRNPGYKRPSAAVVAAVIAGIVELRERDPSMWLAAMLEVLTGARAGTAEFARWDWFVDHGGVEIETGRRIVSFEIRVAKGGESVVPINFDDYELMAAARVAGCDFVVPGETPAERRAVINRLVPWLRGLGLDRRLPNHELRKLFADSKRKAHGTEETTGALGHSDGKLLKFYSESGPRRAMSLLDVIDPNRELRAKVAMDKQLRERIGG